MKTNIKSTSLSQAVWREKKRRELGIERRRFQLDWAEIEKIRQLRYAGNTLAYIAKKFNRSLRTVEKYTKDIIISFTDYDKKMGKGWNTATHPKRTSHPWVEMNKKIFHVKFNS